MITTFATQTRSECSRGEEQCAVVDALMDVQLETHVPIISAVLTPQSFHEHDEHRAFFRRHMVTKGDEAAAACLATIRNLRALKQAR